MHRPSDFLDRYRARRWCTVPVHRPAPGGAGWCGRSDCAKPGKHPDGRFWPAGSADPAHYADRNVGVKPARIRAILPTWIWTVTRR